MIAFEILHGTSPQRRFETGADVMTIGRGSQNQLVVTDFHLSGEHCQVVRERGGYLFRDLRSTNGSVIDRGGIRLPVDAAASEVVGRLARWAAMR